MTSQACIACGMPMEGAEQHARGDETLDYCVHCARLDGAMPSYEEQVESMAGFIVSTQGLDEGAARDAARAAMAELPAWKGHAG